MAGGQWRVIWCWMFLFPQSIFFYVGDIVEEFLVINWLVEGLHKDEVHRTYTVKFQLEFDI